MKESFMDVKKRNKMSKTKERICNCGGKLYTPLELEIPPDKVFDDGSWCWKTEDVSYICLQCGAHYFTEGEV